MHARVINVSIQPGRLDEAIRIFRESIIPAAQRQKGFRGMRLFTDLQTGRGLSISLWETEADLLASEQSGYFAEQLAKVSHLFTAPPERDVLVASAEALPEIPAPAR